jgi:tetratricopeptide (TPR) repeat protein
LKVNPQDLAALMIAGTIYERKGDIGKAQQAYEKVLVLNPRFAPAANNLAWLYLEHGGNKEKALELAQRAKEASPDDPHFTDTLGWILYRRGIYQQAFGLLKESAAKLPDNPGVQYHLGLASLKVGDKAGAQKALTAAVNSPGTFAGKDEARRALADLK